MGLLQLEQGAFPLARASAASGHNKTHMPGRTCPSTAPVPGSPVMPIQQQGMPMQPVNAVVEKPPPAPGGARWGAKFDEQTGKAIPKFDAMTGKQNWGP